MVVLSQDGICLLQNPSEGQGSLILQVLAILRYLKDPTSVSFLSEESTDDPELYDLVLSDGTHKTKCVLSPSLNALVRKGCMRPLSIIKVDEYSWLDRYAVIDHVEILQSVEHGEGLISSGNQIEFSAVQNQDAGGEDERRASAMLPLACNRKYYLSNLDTDCFPCSTFSSGCDQDEKWLGTGPVRPEDTKFLNRLKQSNTPLLSIRGALESDLGEAAAAAAAAAAAPLVGDGNVPAPKAAGAQTQPLIGRLYRVSQIAHYGKPFTMANLPMKFTACLADRGASVTLVFWGGAARHYHARLCEGQVIAVTNYRLRRYRGRLEASVNVRNPSAALVVLSSPHGSVRVSRSSTGGGGKEGEEGEGGEGVGEGKEEEETGGEGEGEGGGGSY